MSRDLRLQVILDAADRVTGPLKKIRRGSSATADSLRENKDQLRALQKQQRDIQSYKTLQTQINRTSDRFNEAQRRVREMREQMQRGEGTTKKFRKEFQKANTSAQDLHRTLRQKKQSLKESQTSLEQAGISTSNLSGDEKRLTERVDQANKSLRRQQDQLKRTADRQRQLSQAKRKFDQQMGRAGAITGAGTRAFAAGGAQLYAGSRLLSTGMDFDAQMSQVQALTRLDKDSDKLAAIREQARELGSSTTFSAGQAAGAQGFLAMAGFDPDAIMAAMPEMLNLAKAGNTELAQTADIASNLLSAFGLAPEEMGRLSDVLVATTTRANVDLEMLGDTMKYVGPVARDMGVSLEEASAMAGLLGNIGIQGSQAGTTMRAMLNRLTKQTGPAEEAMQALNLSTVDLNGNLRPVPDILTDVMNATKDMGTGERGNVLQTIFGTEAGAGVAELIKQQGSAGIEELMAILRQSEGEAARVSDVMSDNARGDLAALSSSFQDVAISIQEVNDGPLRELIQNITSMTRGIGEWVEANPELVATLAKVGSVLATVVAGGGALMMLLGSVLGPIAMARYALSLLGITLGTISAPVLAVIAGVAALAAGAYWVYKNWDGVVAFFRDLWDGALAEWDRFVASLKEAISGGLPGVLKLMLDNFPVFSQLYDVLASAVESLGIEIPEQFRSLGSAIIDGLIGGLLNVGGLKDTVMDTGSKVTGWFKDKLGIKSPSRVFMSHGEDTLAGFRQGLQKGERSTLSQLSGITRRVAGAGALMGAAAMPALAGDVALDNRGPMGTPAASRAPVTIEGDRIEIHIHAQAGTDSEALVRQIEQVLRDREDEKISRARSALHDGD
nr:hypothetical protein 14 [Saccharospirillaceae bacterium]